MTRMLILLVAFLGVNILLAQSDILKDDSKFNDNTNIDWPAGEENSGGVGFRGGGFYGYDREYHEFNPFSPVCYRPYGGWHGVMRTNSYGARFARSIK